MDKNFEKAELNATALKANPYPGRGIITGLDEAGKNFVQVYWIMGRSENSRNRIFVEDGEGRVRTAPADPSKVKDPSLIIYTAMDVVPDDYAVHVVSNGAQTDDVIQYEKYYSSLQGALEGQKYEPDAPNFTPRITSICSIRDGDDYIEMSILKKSPFGDGCSRHFYRFDEFFPGLGYCITTYMKDGDPLPSFEGDPYLMPLKGNMGEVARHIWSLLDQENRISLAVKFISMNDGGSKVEIINKYSAAG